MEVIIRKYSGKGAKELLEQRAGEVEKIEISGARDRSLAQQRIKQKIAPNAFAHHDGQAERAKETKFCSTVEAALLARS